MKQNEIKKTTPTQYQINNKIMHLATNKDKRKSETYTGYKLDKGYLY